MSLFNHALSLRDRSRLIVHQPSRLDAATHIKSLIESGKIHTLQAGRELPLIHEHCPENESADRHVYGFKDLLSGVEAGQLLSDAKFQELSGLAQCPSGAGGEHPPLGLNEAIRIDPSSLETLEQHGLLTAVLSCFQVYVTDSNRDQLAAEIQNWQARQSLFDRHVSLWDAVRADSRFVPVGHSVPKRFLEADEKDPERSEDERPWTALLSIFLADEKNVPVLVDDRACQMLVHNDRRTATAAFATDSLVEALLEAQMITPERAADAYMQLIAWRYRFMVIPARAMVALAKRNLRSPPGRALQQLARYIQDSMRDPGLFGGFEPAEPPLAMAHKLFLAWTTGVTDFIFSLSDDQAIPPAIARAFIEWALTECLPSIPQSAGPNGRVLADLHSRTVLTQAFIHAASRQDTERVNTALLVITGVLGLTDRDYFDRLVEVVDEI